MLSGSRKIRPTGSSGEKINAKSGQRRQVQVALKLIFWPIQAKSIRSMKEMQKFQPLMQKVREKYKDDPQRMNQELWKLQREHGINPAAG